jgi:hypothetical protein
MSTSSPYETVIRLSCVDGISGVLGVIAARAMGLDRTFKELSTSMKLTLGGGALIAGGAGAVDIMWKMAQHGKELLNQQEQLGRAGMSHLDVLKLTADAYDKIAKAVPTAEASEILKTAREMRAIVGPKASMEELEKTTAKAMQVDALLSNTFHRISTANITSCCVRRK